MSSTPTTSTRERVQSLVRYVEAGRFLEALDEFYAEDVTLQENLGPPFVGEAAYEKERAFVAALRAAESRAVSVLVDGDQAVIHWIADYVFTDGSRLRFDQLAHQQWRDGRIVRERFVYDPGTLPLAA
jgi:ketosteroid isomerase-like protein